MTHNDGNTVEWQQITMVKTFMTLGLGESCFQWERGNGEKKKRNS
jgi:hypothetical protein